MPQPPRIFFHRRRRLFAQCLVPVKQINHGSQFHSWPLRHFNFSYSPRAQDRRRSFHASARKAAIKPFLLADIGEGITECELIQWFVHPPARVEQFDKLCEVQSDKASVEITSRYDGVVRKLYVEAGEMAVVGKPLVDIEIPDEITASEVPVEATTKLGATTAGIPNYPLPITESPPSQAPSLFSQPALDNSHPPIPGKSCQAPPRARHADLATPAVRHLTKSLSINLSDVTGTGKDGRVMKEDVQRFALSRSSPPLSPPIASTIPTSVSPTTASPSSISELQPIPLTPIRTSMYRTMTASLAIPHFLYSETYDLTRLVALLPSLSAHSQTKITLLPFILKSLSLQLPTNPLLTSLLLPPSSPLNPSQQPLCFARPHHHLSIAVATPHGLTVPVIHHVEQRSILELATEITRLKQLALDSRLSPQDLTGGVLTVSNIGAAGDGGVVAGRIVDGQVLMLGIGRTKKEPVWIEDTHPTSTSSSAGHVEGRSRAVFSWTADHRLVDGADLAALSRGVRTLLEEPEIMLTCLK